ncbi:Protein DETOXIFICATION 16 [Linum perenne]
MARDEEAQVVISEPSLISSEEIPTSSSSSKSNKFFSRSEIVTEIKKQLWLAGPLASYNFLTYLIQVISVMFVGHLGELPLSAASLATSLVSVTTLTLLRGMASALDTLCGQSHGAKQHHLLGIHLQRSMIVLLLAAIPLSFISAYAGQILHFLHQDPEISAEAGRYARFVIPSIFGFAILECHVKFLQSQNNVFPLMVTTGGTTLLHGLVCWVLVYKSGLGNKGAALANGIAYWSNGLLLFVYVRVSSTCKQSWTGWSKEALHGIPGFVRLAIPSAIMLSLESWSFEMMVLLSGWLPNPKLETSVLSIRLAAYTLILGLKWLISDSEYTRVSNELGNGRPRSALLAVYVAVTMVITEAIVAGTALVLGRNIWGHLYSKEHRVVKYVAQILLLTSAFHLFDAIQSVLSGTCRGCGRQKIGAVVNLGAYYLLGVPCSIVLAFVFHMGGKGLWTGLTVAVFSQALFMTILTITTNWEKEAKKAKDRVYRSIIQEEKSGDAEEAQ